MGKPSWIFLYGGCNELIKLSKIDIITLFTLKQFWTIPCSTFIRKKIINFKMNTADIDAVQTNENAPQSE